MAVSNGKSLWHRGGKTGGYLCFSCAKNKESPPQPLQGGAGEGSLFLLLIHTYLSKADIESGGRIRCGDYHTKVTSFDSTAYEWNIDYFARAVSYLKFLDIGGRMPVITVFGDEYLDEIRTPVALVLMLIVCLSEANAVHQFVILQVEVEGIGGESSLSTWLPECVVFPVSKVFHVGVIPLILWITSKLESFEVKIRVLRLGRLPHLLDIRSFKAS